MKIETILNALAATSYAVDWPARIWEDDELPDDSKLPVHRRQYKAFRARILREFAIYKNFAEATGFDPDQAWFWTDEWQAAEQKVDHHIRSGEVDSFDSMEEFLATLREDDNDSPNN